MRARSCIQFGILAAVVLGTCVWGVQRAEASHRFHCDGEWSGYLFDYCYEGGECYSWGNWHVSVNTDTGEFNFHFHGDTDDYYCFDQHEDLEGYAPDWVANELMYECGICIQYVEKTHVSIDHHGHVFLKVTGYATPCYYPEAS
jgi:hypothetical protein